MAKKAESTLKNMVLSLTAIALVAAAVLALLNGVTKDTVAQVEKNKVKEAIAAVLSREDERGETVKMAFDRLSDTTIYIEDGQKLDSVVCHLAYDGEGRYVGSAVESADANGFGGYFKVMVGFDAAGAVCGYSILKTSETPGLGAKADQWFQRGGKGDIIGKTPSPEELRAKKDKGDVDAITGSTITTRAFLRCVNKAYKNLPSNNE